MGLKIIQQGNARQGIFVFPERERLVPDDVGRALARAGHLLCPLPLSDLLLRRDLFGVLAMTRETSVYGVLALVVSSIGHEADLTETSQARMTTEVIRFVNTVDLMGCATLNEVTSQHVEDFITGAVQKPTGAWVAPAAGTQRLRRSAVRLLYRHGRRLGLATGDPTMFVTVASATPGSGTRPLTDDEDLHCRVMARQALHLTRLPAAWALGQATATAHEIAQVRSIDVDLDRGTVELPGSSRRDARLGFLTDWGVVQLAERLGDLAQPDDPVVSSRPGLSKSSAVSAGDAISRVLAHAGLATRNGVGPRSLLGWAGRRIFDSTGGDIFETARRLGMRSLDQSALLIGETWK